MNKKGMELATNTIVLIVLALATLGIGVAITVGILGQGTDKLLDSIELIDIGVKATPGDPLAGVDAFSIPRNRNKIIAASFYNQGHSECESQAELVFYCPSLIYQYERVNIGVPQNSEKTIGGVLRVDPVVPKRNYACGVEVHCGDKRLHSQITFLRVR